jgi:hypothetical protein
VPLLYAGDKKGSKVPGRNSNECYIGGREAGAHDAPFSERYARIRTGGADVGGMLGFDERWANRRFFPAGKDLRAGIRRASPVERLQTAVDWSVGAGFSGSSIP